MDKIRKAFARFDRADFVPPDAKHMAGADVPLAIGYGQTNSQPTTVEMMLEWLGAQSGDKVLDVGSGSGWTAALLSHIVGPKGKVYAVELVPQLVEFGRQNAERAGVKNARFFQAGKKIGLPEHAPYGRILVSASADTLPKELLEQLNIGGKMIIPIQYSVFEITKKNNGEIKKLEHPGFAFVPLI